MLIIIIEIAILLLLEILLDKVRKKAVVKEDHNELIKIL